MLKNAHILATVAALSFPFGPAFAESHSEEVTAATVVASVNGTDITLGELIVARAQLPEQYQQLPDDVLFDGLVEQMVQQQVLADTLEDVPARVAIALANETRSLRAGEVVAKISEEAVTDEALQAAYDARVAELGQTQEFNASHILVETEEEALAVQEMIAAGADFADTAREISTGPSGPNGGELGWFGPGMMVEPFEAAVVTLEPGEISDPVQTQFGWHIVKLNDTRTQDAPAFEELEAELTGQLQQEAVLGHIDDLVEAAEVVLPEAGSIDASLLSNLDLLKD